LIATLAPRAALLELGHHRLDAHVLAHQVDQLLAEQVLRLLLVEAELVDDPRHARPREDLRGHQMQTLVDIALRDDRLDEIPDTACGSTSTVA
jgi:hypothetical protein